MVNAQWVMSKSRSNFDEFIKSLPKRHPGEGRVPKIIENTGFRLPQE
jgi:hypothetical protein